MVMTSSHNKLLRGKRKWVGIFLNVIGLMTLFQTFIVYLFQQNSAQYKSLLQENMALAFRDEKNHYHGQNLKQQEEDKLRVSRRLAAPSSTTEQDKDIMMTKMDEISKTLMKNDEATHLALKQIQSSLNLLTEEKISSSELEGQLPKHQIAEPRKTEQNERQILTKSKSTSKEADTSPVSKGIVSKKPESFFREIQKEIDNENWRDRCEQFGFPRPAHHEMKENRRIFYGALTADEPHELFEIVAAESYGIFHSMVFVESNMTQFNHFRPLKRVNQGEELKQLFGAQQVEVRVHNEPNEALIGLERE